MRGRRHAVAVAILLVGALAGMIVGTAGAKHRHHKQKFVVGLDNLVAPLAIPANPRPGPVPHCRKPSIKCVESAAQRLRNMEASLGCDHRAVFATTYRVLTESMLKVLRQNPHFFSDPRYLYYEDALFADVYLANSRAWAAGKRVSPAWQIANQAAASGDFNAAQDMLMGINAHVQNDMAFVIAALGTQPRKGGLSKADHDKENEILAQAYQAVVTEVRRRYDPLLDVTNSPLTPLDDEAGLELVKGWREDVWKHANELIDAKTAADDARITNEIEKNAGDWAQMISGAGLSMPGYRAERDAYCASHNPDA